MICWWTNAPAFSQHAAAARQRGVGVAELMWVDAGQPGLRPRERRAGEARQRAAIVGSVVRTIPHSGSEPGTVNPAGVVASFYAVRV